ncbi:MAG: ribonuclease III domain-containing protein [Candidatus Wallbacteria bacterium]|nr:ribonuclease III domain-containing protein [Candidatus Wallbacteria bacterium]
MNLFQKYDPDEYSPLILAYIGDAVFDLYFRMKVISSEKFQTRFAHKKVVSIVNGKRQASFLKKMLPLLTEQELDIVRRARNKKITSHPKGVAMADYRHATSLEALLGYYFLLKDEENLKRLFQMMETILVQDET